MPRSPSPGRTARPRGKSPNFKLVKRQMYPAEQNSRPSASAADRRRLANSKEHHRKCVRATIARDFAGKLRIVTESLAGPRLASLTARRYRISPSQLFSWRRSFRSETKATVGNEPAFVPAVRPLPADGLRSCWRTVVA